MKASRRRSSSSVASPSAPGGASTTPEVFAAHQRAVLVLMNSFLVRYLVALYDAFDGDILEAVVLGEVAHHNVSGVHSKATDPHSLSAALTDLAENRVADLLPTNAFSIAEATGIPRQTVRRRIDSLVGRGWLRREKNGSLFVTTLPTSHFGQFNQRLVADLLATASSIGELRRDPPARR